MTSSIEDFGGEVRSWLAEQKLPEPTEDGDRRFDELRAWQRRPGPGPGAGSDLASLRTRADRVEDGGWLLNGHKVWTTWSHKATWCAVLARTSQESRPYDGISYLAERKKTLHEGRTGYRRSSVSRI